MAVCRDIVTMLMLSTRRILFVVYCPAHASFLYRVAFPDGFSRKSFSLFLHLRKIINFLHNLTENIAKVY